MSERRIAGMPDMSERDRSGCICPAGLPKLTHWVWVGPRLRLLRNREERRAAIKRGERTEKSWLHTGECNIANAAGAAKRAADAVTALTESIDASIHVAEESAQVMRETAQVMREISSQERGG